MDTTREMAVSSRGILCAEVLTAAQEQQLKLLEPVRTIAVMIITSLMNVSLLYL